MISLAKIEKFSVFYALEWAYYSLFLDLGDDESRFCYWKSIKCYVKLIWIDVVRCENVPLEMKYFEKNIAVSLKKLLESVVCIKIIFYFCDS